MFGLSALAAKARELKGSASSVAEKGKKRPASSASGLAPVVRPKRARERVGREGVVALGARPSQSQLPPAQGAASSALPPACPVVVQSVSISSSPEGSPGLSTEVLGVSREVEPDQGGRGRDVGREEIGRGAGGREDIVGCEEAVDQGVDHEGAAATLSSDASPEPSGLQVAGGSAEHSSGQGPLPAGAQSVFKSRRLCFRLLEELHDRFPQDVQQLGELKLNRLVDRSCMNVIQGAIVTGQLHRALGEMQAERNALQARVSELELKESEDGGWERKAEEARGQVDAIERRLKAASEQLQVAEERRSVSEVRANEAEERARQFETKVKAADEKCERAEEKGRDLIKQAKQVQSEAQAAKAESLNKELELKDAQAQLKGLSAELENARGELVQVGDLRAKLDAARLEVDMTRAAVENLRVVLREAEQRAARAEEEALSSLTNAYLHGFNNCRRQAEKLLPDANLSGLDEGDDGCSGEPGAQSPSTALGASGGDPEPSRPEASSSDPEVVVLPPVTPGDLGTAG